VSSQTDAATLTITIPAWVDELAAASAARLDTDEARMDLVVRLSRRNVDEGGGPFAAAVFDGPRLLAAGVNRVLDSGFSIAHGEIVALMHAQHVARRADAPAARPYALFTSCEPCCQCFGALIWSGVTRLVCGATTADAEALGFDEGPKPARWTEVLEARGISVVLAVGREDARSVLEAYVRRGGPIEGLRHPTIR
jgi:tRNA(Arg) A34 adenosine deaminase TadA